MSFYEFLFFFPKANEVAIWRRFGSASMESQAYSNLHWSFTMHILCFFPEVVHFFSFLFLFFFVVVLLFFSKMYYPCFTFNHFLLSWRCKLKQETENCCLFIIIYGYLFGFLEVYMILVTVIVFILFHAF